MRSLFQQLCVLCLVCLGTMAMVFAEEPSDDQLTEEDQLRQAVTWYRLARATNNGMDFHKRAETLYQQVADRTTDSVVKETANRGLDQVAFRIDNAHDTYRTLFEPVWWMAGEDSTIEWYDDVYMLALGNSWGAVEAHLQKELNPENHAAMIFVTRNGDLPQRLLDTGADNFAEELPNRLKLMRDEVVDFTEATPSMTGVPDDLLPFEIDWLSPPTLSNVQISELGRHFNKQGIVVIHANIDDEIEATNDHLSVVRISLATQFWKVGELQPYATIKSVGMGQDAKAHQNVATSWLIGMLLLTFLFSIFSVYRHGEQDKKLPSVLFAAALFFCLGGVWSHLAFGFAADYQVDWGQASLFRETGAWTRQVPYLPSLQWMWVLGLVALGGPILVLMWALTNMTPLLRGLITSNDLQMPVMLTSMNAGVVTWLFLPLVMAHTSEGVWVAISLSLSVIALSWVVSPFVNNLGRGIDNNNQTVIWVIATFILLSCSLALGLFNGWHWAVSVLLGGFAGVLSRQSFAYVEPVVEEDITFVDAENPFVHVSILPRSHQDLVQELCHSIREDQKSICIVDSHATGSSPILIEVHRAFQADTNMTAKVLYLSCEEMDAEPFVFIQRLFGKMGLKTSLMTSVSSQGSVVTESVDSLVSALPGVEFMMGLLGDTAAGLSREAIIQDLTRYLRHGVQKQPLVLILDNSTHIDEASREVMTQVIESEESFLVIWEEVTIGQFRQSPLCLNTEFREVPKIDEDEFVEFLDQFGVQQLPTEVIQDILSITDRDFQRILGVLRHLYQGKVLQKGADGGIHFTSDAQIHAILPSSYEEVEIERFNLLAPEQRLVLESASVCGVIFYAEEVAYALDMSELKVLETLEAIEQAVQPSIVFDVPNEAGIFQFYSRLSQQVIAKRLRYAQTDLPKEIAVRFHKQILRRAQENNFEDIALNRLVHHAMQIVHLQPQALSLVLLKYIETLGEQFAWPEIVDVYTEQQSFIEYMSVESKVRIQVWYAKAIAAHPNREQYRQVKPPAYSLFNITAAEPVSNPEAAMQFLARTIEIAIHLPEPAVFHVIKTWCQISYVRETAETFPQYAQEIALQVDGAIRAYVESYYHSNFRFSRNIAPDLKQLLDRVRQLPESGPRQFTLGSILKEYAGQYFYHTTQSMDEAQTKQFWYNDVLPLYEEANQLMLRSKDWNGLATSYGLQASTYLYTLKDFTKAIDLLQQDLDLILQYHFVNHEASIYTRMSQAYTGLLEQALSATPLDLDLVTSLYDQSIKSALLGKEIAEQRHDDRIVSQADACVQKLKELKAQHQLNFTKEEKTSSADTSSS